VEIFDIGQFPDTCSEIPISVPDLADKLVVTWERTFVEDHSSDVEASSGRRVCVNQTRVPQTSD
jgi:hypothetical protein